jgi:hypothetical protein
MKVHEGVDVQIIFLTLALAGGEWSVSRFSQNSPGERAPSTHWTRGQVGPRTSLDIIARENSCLYQDSNSDPLLFQPTASHYTD